MTYDAPDDYRTRYTQFDPATTLQNVNLSPDFPSVAQVLMSLAPQAGLTKVDGVLAVDPQGLAALLELTGPVDVVGWPTPISAENVVKVTLSEAYAEFAETPERADFLGDVAQVAVDAATSGNLGRPAQIAKVLGAAAHSGHLILAFARPEEQQLAVELGVSGRMEPVRSDAVALTSSNASREQDRLLPPAQSPLHGEAHAERARHGSPRLELARRHPREHRHRHRSPADRDRPLRPALLRRERTARWCRSTRRCR